METLKKTRDKTPKVLRIPSHRIVCTGVSRLGPWCRVTLSPYPRRGEVSARLSSFIDAKRLISRVSYHSGTFRVKLGVPLDVSHTFAGYDETPSPLPSWGSRLKGSGVGASRPLPLSPPTILPCGSRPCKAWWSRLGPRFGGGLVVSVLTPVRQLAVACHCPVQRGFYAVEPVAGIVCDNRRTPALVGHAV